MFLQLFLYALIGLTTGSPSNSSTYRATTELDISYRLPHDVEPTFYTIDLRINSDFPTTKTYQLLKVEITLKVLKATNSFSLHYALRDNLNVANLRLWDIEDPQNRVPITKSLNLQNQQLTITLDNAALLETSKSYILSFAHLTGDLGTDMYGFYLSDYVDKTGQKIYAASTQFQTIHARKAFPCFDEPIFKAIFQLSIIYPQEYATTASNTAGIVIRNPDPDDPNMIQQQFGRTPRMSSYLIAFVVSKFAVRTISSGSYNYLIFFPGGFEDATEYSSSITEPIIAAMEYRTGIRYPDLGIPQLFQVAMPDFAAGAMENWGLAIYRERGLLWTAEESSNRQKQYVCSIIAHEISHMWFGDYVTTNWWSEAWLNEGFATFFAAKVSEMVEPEWSMMDQFVVNDLQSIMQSDAIFGSWPLTSLPEDVTTPGQISAKFGGITYSKGGSVIRMMEHFVGETKFYAALNDYLNTNNLQNTLPINLWNAFDQQNLLTLPAEVSMKAIMESWTEKAGFPVVTVKRSGNNAVLSQTRFLLTTGTDTTKWYVPITYTTSQINRNFKNTAVQEWLLPSADLTIPNVFVNNDWIILNVQETGYYRVDYSAELWTRIRDLLLSDRFIYIHEINRAQIIDDVMNLARVQTNKYETALDITKYLVQETDYLPWYVAINSFSYLMKRIAVSDEVYGFLQAYIIRMSNKLYKSVKFEIEPNQNHLDVFRTVMALQWACDLGVQECTGKAKTAFATYKDGGTNVDPNLRSIVYCNAIRQNVQSDWDFLWSTFSGFKMSTEKVTIISALGCASNREIINKYLQLSISATSGIKSQDAMFVFTAVLNGNPSNVDVALDFLIDNFQEIANHYGGMRSIARIIEGIADRITLTAQVNKFKQFISDHRPELEDAVEAAEAAIANAEVNIAWFNSYRNTVLDWLKREKDGGGGGGGGGGGAATICLSLSTVIVRLLLYLVQ